MVEYSTIIPAYNAASTIAETLHSVRGQTARCTDIIMVDDGSNDCTTELVRKAYPDVRLIRQSNSGPGAATNAGLAAARFDFIAFLDADDLWVPTKIARQIAVLIDAPAACMTFAQMRQFQHEVGDDGQGKIHPAPARSTLMITRKAWELVGDIVDPPGRRGEMIDWFARARELEIPRIYITEVLGLRRIIPGSLSYGRNETRDRGYLHVARQAILRRRARGNQP